MDIKKGFATAALLLASMAGVQAEGQTVYAYVAETVPANSDVLVSVPVNNNVEVELTTSSVSGTVITVPNSPDFAAGDYNAATFVRYYVRFIDGPASGLWSSITANSETTLTINNPDVAALASSGGGDTIRVYAHHTLESVFPKAQDGISTISTPGQQTQVLYYSTGDSQNKAPGSGFTATFLSPIAGWGPNAARPILPEEGILIRNRSLTDSITYIKPGIAPDHEVSILVEPTVARDTAIGTGYPVDVLLPDTNLGSVLQNQVLFQTIAGQNNAPGNAGTFTYINPAVEWTSGNTKKIAGNTAFIFRQPATDAGGKRTISKPY